MLWIIKERREKRKMKEYGAFKATEFTKKQIGMLYKMAKNGELKIEKWVIADLYDLADYYNYDYNRSVERAETDILKILKAVFSNEIEKAQILINDYTEKNFNSLSRKNQLNADRTFL